MLRFSWLIKVTMTSETTFKKGEYIKLFLSNGFKYEGHILDFNSTILTIADSRGNEKRHIVIAHIVDFQTIKKRGDGDEGI